MFPSISSLLATLTLAAAMVVAMPVSNATLHARAAATPGAAVQLRLEALDGTQVVSANMQRAYAVQVRLLISQ